MKPPAHCAPSNFSFRLLVFFLLTIFVVGLPLVLALTDSLGPEVDPWWSSYTKAFLATADLIVLEAC